MTNRAWIGRGHLMYFLKISDNILKTVQVSFIVSIKFEQEVGCTVSNGHVTHFKFLVFLRYLWNGLS